MESGDWWLPQRLAAQKDAISGQQEMNLALTEGICLRFNSHDAISSAEGAINQKSSCGRCVLLDESLMLSE